MKNYINYFDLEEFEEIGYIFASWMVNGVRNNIYILVNPDFNKNNVTLFNDFIYTDANWAKNLTPLTPSELDELKNVNTNKITIFNKEITDYPSHSLITYSELIKMHPELDI